MGDALAQLLKSAECCNMLMISKCNVLHIKHKKFEFVSMLQHLPVHFQITSDGNVISSAAIADALEKLNIGYDEDTN